MTYFKRKKIPLYQAYGQFSKSPQRLRFEKLKSKILILPILPFSVISHYVTIMFAFLARSNVGQRPSRGWERGLAGGEVPSLNSPQRPGLSYKASPWSCGWPTIVKWEAGWLAAFYVCSCFTHRSSQSRPKEVKTLCLSIWRTRTRLHIANPRKFQLPESQDSSTFFNLAYSTLQSIFLLQSVQSFESFARR